MPKRKLCYHALTHPLPISDTFSDPKLVLHVFVVPSRLCWVTSVGDEGHYLVNLAFPCIFFMCGYTCARTAKNKLLRASAKLPLPSSRACPILHCAPPSSSLISCRCHSFRCTPWQLPLLPDSIYRESLAKIASLNVFSASFFKSL